MAEVTVKKQTKIVELYFGGQSYNDIAQRVGVGKGSVVKVIDDLRHGKYPELSGVAGDLESLRETAVRLNKEGMTPERAATGLAILDGVISSGVSPEEMPKALALLKAMSPAEVDQRQFVQAALYLWNMKEETGKDPSELRTWVEGLEERRQQAESLASSVEGLAKQRGDLEQEKSRLERDLAVQKGRLQTLTETSNTLRDEMKSERSALRDLNESTRKTQAEWTRAERRLSQASGALEKIRALGLDPEEWVPIERTLRQINKRYGLDPGEFKEDLLEVVGAYGSLLDMERELDVRRQELSNLAVDRAKICEEKARVSGEVTALKEQKAALQGTLAVLEKQSTQAMTALQQGITLAAQRAGAKATQDIGALVARLTTEVAVKLGQERDLKEHVEALEGSIESYAMLKALADLVLERGEITPEDARFLCLTVLRKAKTQLERSGANNASDKLKAWEVEKWVNELQKWEAT